MKYKITLILILFAFNIKAQTTNFNDSLISNPQNVIKNTFINSSYLKNNETFIKINNKLTELYTSSNSSLFLYWLCYSKYYNSILYLIKDDKKNAKKEIDEAIEKMKNISNKNEEELILLANIMNFSIQFYPMKAVFLSKEVVEFSKQALSLDSLNIRAYLTLGINDYFTPEMFGGMTNCENFFLKALSLPPQKIKNEILPSWGREEAFEYIIRYYIYIKQFDKAKKYFKEATSEFPHSFNILNLESKIKP